MNELQITKQNARAAHKTTDAKGKELLETLLGKEVFNEKITDRIKTFEDACDELQISGGVLDMDELTTDEAAYRKLKIIARALNQGWIPDWNNSNQRKWAPWFYMNQPGFRFCASYFGIAGTRSTGGSRLCFASEELADYAAKQFLSLYQDFLN